MLREVGGRGSQKGTEEPSALFLPLPSLPAFVYRPFLPLQRLSAPWEPSLPASHIGPVWPDLGPWRPSIWRDLLFPQGSLHTSFGVPAPMGSSGPRSLVPGYLSGPFLPRRQPLWLWLPHPCPPPPPRHPPPPPSRPQPPPRTRPLLLRAARPSRRGRAPSLGVAEPRARSRLGQSWQLTRGLVPSSEAPWAK